MTSLQTAVLALALVFGAAVAEASGGLAPWTLGVECDLTASGSIFYWGVSEKEVAEAADRICRDLLAYLGDPRSKSVLSAWSYVANQRGIGGTMTFRVGPRPAPGQCHRLQLEFRTEGSSKTLFDEPLYEVGNWKCSREPKKSAIQTEFTAGFLRELQAHETPILEYLQYRVPLLATDGYIRLTAEAKRADFLCCQLEWERYRKLRASLFALKTGLPSLMTAQGTRDFGQATECSAKHLMLTVCEDPEADAVAAVLQQSKRQSVRTEILLESYVDPEIKLHPRVCEGE